MPFTCLFNMLIAMRNRQVFFVCAVGLALILGSGGCSHGPSDSAVTVTQTVTPSNPTSMSATSTTISSSRAATPATQQVEEQLENAGGRAFPEVEEETYEPVPRMGPLSDLDFDAPPQLVLPGLRMVIPSRWIRRSPTAWTTRATSPAPQCSRTAPRGGRHTALARS